MPKPPVDPGYFDKINYVVDSWTNPCQAPWYIYIETMAPAALEAFITLMTFGWDDVLRGWWRPKGLRGGRHGRRGKRFKPRRFYFPELGEEIGKRMPFAEQVKGRKWSCLGKTLWRIDSAVQHALFWWLVADVTIDFAFNWTSLLYESKWCQQAHLGSFSYNTDGGQILGGNVFHPISYGNEDYERPPPWWNLIEGDSGPTGCTVSGCLDVVQAPPFPPPSNITIRIRDVTNDQVYDTTGPVEVTDLSECGLVGIARLPADVLFRIEVMHDATFARAGPGAVVAIANE